MCEINEITEGIIGCVYKVSNGLGAGFLEKVYENALAHELQKSGFSVKQQHAIDVYYDDIVVGSYVADLIVEEKVLLELKAARGIEDVYMAQCLNYLGSSVILVGILAASRCANQIAPKG